MFGSEKKNNKNCMILHCKNAEITITLSFLHFYSVKLSFLHFYSVKSYNFCYFLIFFFFFLNLAVFTLKKIKKVKNIFFFLKCKNLGWRIRKPRNKRKIAK